MTLSMFQASAPIFLRELSILSAILTKAEAFAKAKKIEDSVLLQSRLAADMLPLVRQVQFTSDTAKGAVARLSGLENPSFADTETTFAELQARLQKTIDFVKTATAEQIDGSEKKTITLRSGGGNERTFEGQDYLFNHALPNVFFHISIAYAILRHNGVEIGKKDYLGTN